MRRLICLSACVLLLAGCGGTGNGSGEAKETVDGETISATVKMNGEKVESVSIDETSDGESKKDKKDSYGLKQYSSIGKEWYEQIQYLENYLVEHGSDSLTFDEQGRAKNSDVLSGCTISIEKYVDVYNKAKADAQS